MAQCSLDMLGMGLQRGPTGFMLVQTKCRSAQVARADQDKPLYSAIPGYLEAAQGFARLWPALLAPPKAGQPCAASSTHAHSGVSWLPCNVKATEQSRCNRQRCRVRCCRKLSLGSVDSGIDMDATLGLREGDSNDMRVGRVLPMLTMGHG